jgi:hypothetical protein
LVGITGFFVAVGLWTISLLVGSEESWRLDNGINLFEVVISGLPLEGIDLIDFVGFLKLLLITEI